MPPLRILILALAAAAAGAAAPAECDEAFGCDAEPDEVALLQKAFAVTPAQIGGATGATVTSTTPPPTGVGSNAKGDLEAFKSALMANTGACVFFVLLFSILRRCYPLMYSNNALTGKAPAIASETFLGWLPATWDAKLESVIEHTGLDQTMLLEFTHLAMKITLLVGMPHFLVFGPMNYFFGGHPASADRLSYLSFGNVKKGSWLYWLYAVVVWGVVAIVQSSIWKAQSKFLERRFAWLRSMPVCRANTVLVEGIPEQYRSDEKLCEFFEDILPGDGNVERAYVCKDTSVLMPVYLELKECRRALVEAEARLASKGGWENNRPTVRLGLFAGRVDSIQHYTRKIAELEPLVEAAKASIVKEAASGVGGVNLSSGFITFSNRVEAEIALRLDGVSCDSEEWRLSTPPAAQDVLWQDLQQDEMAERLRHAVGYLAIAGLYFAYMPLVVGVTNLAKLVDLGPLLQPFWQGLAPTLGLQIMVAFLPTVIKLIFEVFFTLKAAQWAQHKLQSYYFGFQVVFVIMATAVGQNFRAFMQALIADPLSLIEVMAKTMPYATHFYMNFLVLQWVTHCMNLTRYVQLTKFLIFRRIYDDETARAMAEPEDQDYYGMGSRSARWTTNLVIAIVFGTLSPPIYVLALANFVITRIVYGYLLPYAETKKTDLGGAFWVSQLQHVYVGNIIYCLLMTGVLYSRASSIGPMLIAAPSIGYVLWSKKRFDTALAWENLPFQELMQDATTATEKRHSDAVYIQPQLEDTPLAAANLGQAAKK